MDRNKKEFLELIRGHQNIINKVCNIYCYKESFREDMYQEIVYNLWKSYPGFRRESKFSTWMYRVALNTALSFNRKEDNKLVFSDNKLSESPDLSNDADSDKIIELLYSAIKALNNLDKAIMMLWLDRNSYSDIAEITGLSESNVSVKLVRIKNKLKEKLSKVEIN